MTYYTFSGSIEEIREIVQKDVSAKDVDTFTEMLIASSESEEELKLHFPSEDIGISEEAKTQLLIPGTSYSIKISTAVYEIFLILVRFCTSEEKLILLPSILPNIHNIKRCIQKMTGQTYCLYKKLLSLAWEKRVLTLELEDISHNILTTACNIRTPASVNCDFKDMTQDACNFDLTKMSSVLNTLAAMNLVVYNDSTVTVQL